jgi:hypothetical protein
VRLCPECMPAMPIEPPRLAVAFDAVQDVLIVEGVRFTGSMLRAMARKPHGTTLKLVKWPDGSVTMSTPSTRRRSR